MGIGRYWLGDFPDLPEEALIGKSCSPVPCPSFEDVALEVTGFCTCINLAPGRLYAQGCVIHDPAAAIEGSVA